MSDLAGYVRYGHGRHKARDGLVRDWSTQQGVPCVRRRQADERKFEFPLFVVLRSSNGWSNIVTSFRGRYQSDEKVIVENISFPGMTKPAVFFSIVTMRRILTDKLKLKLR